MCSFFNFIEISLQQTSMANAIDNVAASGEETLRTVDDNQKTSILKSVEALASSMESKQFLVVLFFIWSSINRLKK